MKQLTIIGNIGQDAERQNINGNDYLRFSVAVNEKRKDGTKSTEWFTVWTRQTNLAQWLTSGTLVFVQGRPNFKAYLSKTINEYQVGVSINAEKIQLLGGGDKKEETPKVMHQHEKPKKEEIKDEEILDDDIPF